MNRITVTLNEVIEQQLRNIQGGLISGRKQDVSFTTTINTVLLAGILGSSEFSDKTWALLKEFLDNEKVKLEPEGLTDNYLNELK